MRPIRDYPPDDYDAVIDGPPRFARIRRALSTGIGAAVALGLIVALGVWFYRLGVRDAESVPIIRASAEPAKSRPEEPGGVVTPYQDITSYRVAESRPTTPAPTVLAPPAPEPRPEDVAMGRLAPESSVPPAARRAEHSAQRSGERPDERPAERPAPEAATLPGEGDVPAVDEEIDAELPEDGIAAAVVEEVNGADEIAAGELAPMSEADVIAALVRQATLQDGAPETAPAPVAAVVTDAAPVGANLPPLPPARPADLSARIAASVRSAETRAAELARRAAESAVQIQLAADPDEQAVRAMWQRISQANQDILHDRQLAVQPTVSGGMTYYRLRVGPFSGTSEAHAVCQALQARGQDCIVARNG
jgi:hypothetical protein